MVAEQRPFTFLYSLSVSVLSEWHCQDGLLGVGVMGEGWRNIYSAPFPIGYDWSLGT